MKKISEWLCSVSAYTVYRYSPLAKDFYDETNQQPVWPTHTLREARTTRVNVTLTGALGDPVVYGYEVADTLARQYVPDYPGSSKRLAGDVYLEALDTLKKAKL